MPITVQFEEHEDSPSESGNRAGDFRFTRVFVTAYADRWTFVRELFTGGPVGLPMAYSTEWPGVFADTFDIARIVNNPIHETITDPSVNVIRHHGKALITVTYSPMERSTDGTLMQYEQQEAGEFVTVPSRGLKWLADDQPLPADYSAAYPSSTTRHVVTWSQVRNVPWATLASTLNKVNSVPFTVPITGQVFRPGTLLFADRSASITLNTSGQTTWRIGLTFLEKAQTTWSTLGEGPIDGSTVYGWNYQWREDTGTFDQPVNATTEAKTFQETDLKRIFTATV